MTSSIVSKADHINCVGDGMVKNEEVQAVLKELDKYPGVFYEGVSMNGMTIIEKVE